MLIEVTLEGGGDGRKGMGEIRTLIFSQFYLKKKF